MEAKQSGAKKGCSGTMDNLLIDKMVTHDCQCGKRSLSMAWVDVTKAYDTVDHDWLCEMMEVHRFPRWLEVWLPSSAARGTPRSSPQRSYAPVNVNHGPPTPGT